MKKTLITLLILVMLLTLISVKMPAASRYELNESYLKIFGASIRMIIASMVECFLILPGHLAHALQPRKKRHWSFMRHMLVAFSIGLFILLAIGQDWDEVGFATLGDWLAPVAKLKQDIRFVYFALILAEAGARVVVAARRIDRLESLVRRITDAGVGPGRTALIQTQPVSSRRFN